MRYALTCLFLLLFNSFALTGELNSKDTTNYDRAEYEKFFFSKLKNSVNTFSHESGMYYSPVFTTDSKQRPSFNDSITVSFKATNLKHQPVAGNEPHQNIILENTKVNTLFYGFKLALMSMSLGDRYIFYIPSSLAYSNTPPAGLEKGESLILDISLLSINK